MKITEIHIYQAALPVKNGPYTMAGQVVHELDSTIVRLVGSNGFDGWGEVCPVGPLYAPVNAAGIRSTLQQMAGHLIGHRPEPLAIRRTLDGVLHGEVYAKAAIDIAAHDLWAKSLGISVSSLLGGAVAHRLPSYYVLGINTPEETARLAKEKVQEGYPQLQLKVGGRPVEEDIAVIRKVYDAVKSNVRLAVDANRGLLTRDAILLSEACRSIPFVLEQPCHSIEEAISLRHHLHHPLYLDESMIDIANIIRVIGEGLVDGFGMKVTRLGGLGPFQTFRDICAARNLAHTCDDSWGGDIIAAACIQMASTVDPRRMDGAWIATPYIEGSYVPENPVQVVDGHVTLPDGPGLGIQPEESAFSGVVERFG